MDNVEEKKELVAVKTQEAVEAAHIAAEKIEESRKSQAELMTSINREEMRNVLFEFFGNDDPKEREILVARVPYICETIERHEKHAEQMNLRMAGMEAAIKRVEPVVMAYEEQAAGKRYISDKSKTLVTLAGVIGALMAIAAFIKWFLMSLPK